MYYSLLVFILSILLIILLLYKIRSRPPEIELKISEHTPKVNFLPWINYSNPVDGEIIVSKSEPKKWEVIVIFLSSISAVCSIVDFIINRMDLILKILKG